MFHLSYTLLEHGWAVATSGDGTTTVETPVSCLSDALGDLARAARGILRGMPETSFNLIEEPGEHRFRVTRDGDQLTIRAERFGKPFARPDEAGELVLEARCSVREFTNECINVLRRVFDEHGEAGYRERWRSHAFPTAEYHELLELRRGLAAARPAKQRGAAAARGGA